MAANRFPSVSVVIPTLGGQVLVNTINKLNAGTLVPNEIIICIPKDEVSPRLSFNKKNIKILQTPFYGQVGQRAEGFKHAISEIVIQIDDDINVEQNCIRQLVDTLLETGPDSCVAPLMYNNINGESVAFSSKKKWLNRFFYWIINGNNRVQPGTISRAGTGIGHFYDSESNRYYETEWLAGGCVAHYRKNLITEDYYPYSGKAFCEDLIHSVLLKRKGCRLILEPRARCGIEVQQTNNLTLREYVSLQYQGYMANRYFVKMNNNSIIRLNIYYFLLVINHAIRIVRKKLI